MHVLAGQTALRALRFVRYRQPVVALPEIERRSYRLRFLGRDEPMKLVPVDRSTTLPVPMLESTGFSFESVECNMHVELWQLGDIGTFTKETPLELAVFERGKRVHQLKMRTRELPRALPADSLVRVNPYLYFVGPELIVAQLAPKLSLLQLTQLIMELCGTYSLYPVPEQGSEAQYELPPVTTVERIRHYAAYVKLSGGASKLRKALAYAIEGSASPSETLLSLAMSLPRAEGGYGFGKPTLNVSLEPPEWVRGLVGGGSYILDAFWEDALLDMEYESAAFHLDPLASSALVAAREHPEDADPEATVWRSGRIAKADADRRRARDLEFLGIQVVPVTPFDLRDVRRMDQVAAFLARALEKRGVLDFDAWKSRLEEHAYRLARQQLLEELRANLEPS